MNQAAIDRLNGLSHKEAASQFRKCCNAGWWGEQMAAGRPYGSHDDLMASVEAAFDRMPDEGWRAAFASHPRIGDIDSLRMRLAGNKEWSAGEQAGAADADEAVLRRLAEANEEYYQRFGYIFIVCASGKSAQQMLGLLEARLTNPPDAEFLIAAEEQRKIARLRLEKLLAGF